MAYPYQEDQMVRLLVNDAGDILRRRMDGTTECIGVTSQVYDALVERTESYYKKLKEAGLIEDPPSQAEVGAAIQDLQKTTAGLQGSIQDIYSMLQKLVRQGEDSNTDIES